VTGEGEQIITAICCIRASGNDTPPKFVFPQKRMKVRAKY
jgi:hypothetical protein